MKLRKDVINLPVEGKRTWLKSTGMAIAGIICIIYLLNPDAGVLELIPDNIPIIGNLDEVAATILLLKALKYFRWDIFGLFGAVSSKKQNERNKPETLEQ